MDIIIKSFNRPYYLDRCLKSIYEFVSGPFDIYVLDDGTPKIYLNKIKSLYPSINIVESDFYHEKAQAIEDHITGKKKYSLYSIPNKFWINHISNSTDFFLLLEDDIWLTSPIDMNEVHATMLDNNLVFLKIWWGSNKLFVKGKKRYLSTNFQILEPSIPWIKQIVFFNKFKLGSLFYRLKLHKENLKFYLPFYTYYSVASAFFEKGFWLYLWKNSDSHVNEMVQLKQAVQWIVKKQDKVGMSNIELTKTSFITSSFNSFKDIELDMLKLNHHFNEAWVNGKLDCMENFPNDFKVEYLQQFLNSDDNEKLYAAWLEWINNFKSHYKSLGSQVD